MSRRPRRDFEHRTIHALEAMAPAGLIASESPVHRPVGTRVASPPPPPPPTPGTLDVTLIDLSVGPMGRIVGGAGNATLGDESDSTYVVVSIDFTAGYKQYGDIEVTFESANLTTETILSASLEFRYKSSTGNGLRAAILSYPKTVIEPLTNSWVTASIPLSWVPTVAQANAGLKCYLEVYPWDFYVQCEVEIAEFTFKMVLG